ncbi:hypothetical protein GWI33_018811 [Rhynchophorus ferrugineus]|uniref:Uncharacterized protein n=1 Tax=Rhynchophorus ferrugineus TaxID=354439 RepID=A0A834HSW4_RHYFE|nr:hypothetical protein GWI33_018811 [Rhynchophorus ferrugineus]
MKTSARYRCSRRILISFPAIHGPDENFYANRTTKCIQAAPALMPYLQGGIKIQALLQSAVSAGTARAGRAAVEADGVVEIFYCSGV